MFWGFGWAATFFLMTPSVGVQESVEPSLSTRPKRAARRPHKRASRTQRRQRRLGRHDQGQNIYEQRDDRHLGPVPDFRRGQVCYRPFGTKEAKLSSPFEWRYNNGILWEMHNGLDLLVPVGRPVPSATFGEVVATGEDRAHSIYVTVRVVPQNRLKGEDLPSGRRYEITYTHLSRADVSEGQWVLPGDQLGLSGETGFHGIPHLHISVEEHHGNGGPRFYIDPARFLNLCAYPKAMDWPHRPNVRQRVLVRDTGCYEHNEFVARSQQLTGEDFPSQQAAQPQP